MKEYYSPVNFSDGSFFHLELNSYVSRTFKNHKRSINVQFCINKLKRGYI